MQVVFSLSQLQYFQFSTVVKLYKKNKETQKFCPLAPIFHLAPYLIFTATLKSIISKSLVLVTKKSTIWGKICTYPHHYSYMGAALTRFAKGQGALCTKCHNSGHNRTRCTFATCISATICGHIKRHPDENKYLKDQSEGLKKLKAKVTSIELDIKK